MCQDYFEYVQSFVKACVALSSFTSLCDDQDSNSAQRIPRMQSRMVQAEARILIG